MLFRLALPSDAEAIGRVRVTAWRAAYRDFMPAEYLAALDPAGNLDSLRSALGSAEPPFVLKVLELDGEVVAFSALGAPRYEAAPRTLELWALYVEPAHWRKGIGRELLLQSLQDARDRGQSTVELWCIKGNRAAIALYEAAGFVPTGIERTTSVLTGHPLCEVAYARGV